VFAKLSARNVVEQMKKWLAFFFSLVLIGSCFFLWSNPNSPDAKQNEEQDLSISEKSQRSMAGPQSMHPVTQVMSQPSIAETGPTGSGVADTRSEGEKPLDARLQAGASLKPLDRDLIKRVSSLAWISSSGSLEPESNEFDQKILDKSMHSPGWRLYKELRNGIYAGILETRGTNASSFPFWIYLNASGPNGIQPSWLRWSDDDSVGTLFDLAFSSPFSGQEIYLKAIHLPSLPFAGKGVRAESCKEVILIPYMETAPDVKYIDSVSSKAFCRKDITALSPIGQIAFMFDHSE
jgi:hypothetical protein